MKVLIVSLLILAFANSGVLSQSECSANEEYLTCGTACPATCDNWWRTDLICTANCVEGCFCVEGYVRNDDGVCVPISECSNSNTQCPANEEYLTCGTACQATCSNWMIPKPCVKICIQGCFCKSGYVRSTANGPCVPKNQCLKKLLGATNQCPANEEYSTCGTACQATCANYKNPEPCVKMCVEGCFCKPEYVRKTPNGPCIPTIQCSTQPITTQCPLYEEYKECGSACPPTCDSPKDQVCIQVCTPGCFCIDGYVRNGKSCILREKCPIKPC